MDVDFSARSALERARSVVVVGAADYADELLRQADYQHCTHTLLDGELGLDRETGLVELKRLSDIQELEAPLVLIARRSARGTQETANRLRQLGLTFDHLALHTTRSRSPRLLKALGRTSYEDLDSNVVSFDASVSDRVEVDVGEMGVSSGNVVDLANVSVRERLSITLVGSDGCVTIGQDTTFVDATIFVNSTGTVSIGRDCMFAREIELNQSDQHHIFDLDTLKRINHPRDVVIGDHVWVGRRALLLAGVSIGSGSVVGAAAVTSGAFASNVVLAGSPARVLRERVVWSRDLVKYFDRSTFEDCDDQRALEFLEGDRLAGTASSDKEE